MVRPMLLGALFGASLGASLGVLPGCNDAFGLRTQTEPDAGAILDRCAPVAPDPLRYASLFSATGAWAWDTARVACQLRGMDLAVINDEHELAMADVEVRPYWVGDRQQGSAWTTVDGCPVVAGPADAPKVTANGNAAGDQCGLVDQATSITGASCDGALSVYAALCETPRADLACLPSNGGRETYAISDGPLGYRDAQAFCTSQHGHLAVIDSSLELAHLSKVATERAFPSFWLGAKLAANTWTSETGCPALFAWSGGAPAPAGSTACASGTMVARLDDLGATLVQLDGVTASSCEAEQFVALCEL